MNMSEQTRTFPAGDTPATGSMTEQLVALQRRPVDMLARQRAVWHWLDWIGCVAAAYREPAAQALMRWQPLGCAEQVTKMWPSLAGSACTDMQAVWLDAGLANIQEMDDMHREAILHPGPVVLPVVAHVARHRGLDAHQALDAVVRGYEATVRVGRALGPAHYARLHNTATAGVFGAATAAADALGLSDVQTVWSLGNAGTQAAGLWQVRLEPVMSKHLHTGHAAWAGLSAATLAQVGFTGPRQILEGEKGFFAALCPDAMPERVLEPADDWLIHGTSFKPWPACRHTHAVIDCVLALRERLGASAMDYTEALVEGFGDAIHICDQPRPQTTTQAKFSLQYAVAAAARWGPLLPEHFDAIQWGDASMQSAARRVQLRIDEALSDAYPAHYGARVTLRLADGNSHSAQVADSLGDPERPMSENQILAKARNLMVYGGVAPARMQAVLDAALNLQKQLGEGVSAPMPRALLDPLF